jgi:hypothetical protein
MRTAERNDPMRKIAVLALAAVTLAAPAFAQSKPAKVRLTEKSGKGAALIRVPDWGVPYALQFSKNGSSGFLSRVYIIKVKPRSPGSLIWISKSLSPGRYRLDSLWQQGRWSACLERGTIEFDVKPGRIAYVGTVDTHAVHRSLFEAAADAGRTTLGGPATSYYLSHGKAEVPPVGDRDEAGLGAARAFAGESMASSGRLVELATVRRTTFGTSKAGKAIKVCG